jgi:hypothetical protein
VLAADHSLRRKSDSPLRFTTPHKQTKTEAHMKQRSPIAVFFLPFLTLGIYSLVWYVKTGREMRSKGAAIPTAWLILIPIVNLYWLVKWSGGVAKVTNNSFSAIATFLVVVFLGPIGMAIIQSSFNRVQ